MFWRATLLTLVGSISVTHAQEILLPTTLEDDGSVRDQPRGGPAEEVLDLAFISLQASREWRAFSEHEISATDGLPLSRAEVSGVIAVNNGLDTGLRTIELSLYAADGALTLEDFDQGTLVLGTVTYAPPGDSSVPFTYDILTELETFIAAGATHIGLRARSTVIDAPNALSMVAFEIATLCGNGALDPGEACDDGVDNSDTDVDACRRACLDAFCGDGVVDTGETCDEGEANGPDGTCPTGCGVVIDAGMPDAGSDAGSDAALPDTGGVDGGSDAGFDAGLDAGAGDAGLGVDAGMMDTGGGCGCRTTGSSAPISALAMLLFFARRRRLTDAVASRS